MFKVKISIEGNGLNYIEFVGVTIGGFLTFTWKRQTADGGQLDDLSYLDLHGPNIVQSALVCSRVTSEMLADWWLY